MDNTSNPQLIAPVESDAQVQPTVDPVVAQTSKPEEIKPSTNVLLSVLKSLSLAVVGFIVAVFKTFLDFFLHLTFKGKVSFILILLVFGILVATISHNSGYNLGKNDIENRVRAETGMTVEDLIRVSDKLKDLNMTLDSILKGKI